MQTNANVTTPMYSRKIIVVALEIISRGFHEKFSEVVYSIGKNFRSLSKLLKNIFRQGSQFPETFVLRLL